MLGQLVLVVATGVAVVVAAPLAAGVGRGADGEEGAVKAGAGGDGGRRANQLEKYVNSMYFC